MKIDRLMGTLAALMQNERVTAPCLAEKFEVTRRTISRDIDALCRAGIPIVTRQGAGGGLSIAEGYRLDRSVLTADELSGIIAALRGIGSVSGESQVERTLDKLRVGRDAAVSLREPVVIDLAAHQRAGLTDKIGGLKQAIRESRRVAFDYFSEKGEAKRVLEPCLVVFQWSAWYVFGFCCDRLDFRLFKLTRLSNLRILDERFAPREIPPERRNFGAFLEGGERLVALFHPSARHQLMDEYGPDAWTVAEDGALRLEVRFASRRYIIAWLLGFGNRVRVLEPSSLAGEIRDAAEKIPALYS